jgi:UDP-N-acetylmuramate: L-alanyl-gamma-D-glutamyl-meso-diaminopimelate ligase
VRNAVAAIAVGSYVGLTPGDLADGLRMFKGIKRRLEIVGNADGVTVIDDFAHHPTAVHETLSALRSGYPGRRVWAVFEPRSASSCRRIFQDDFARAFGAADEVILAAVFRSSLPDSERLSAEQLVEDLRVRKQRARYIAEIDDIIATVVNEHRSGDIVVLMSNGGFGGIHRKLLQALG